MKSDSFANNWWDGLSEGEFQEMFRMSRKTLVDLQAEIDHSENIYDERIETSLLACLWFLGNTKSLQEVECLFDIKNTECAIEDYLTKILGLGSEYIVWPSVDESKLIEKGFLDGYHFPTVVGVIGSLYIEINAGDRTDANLYYNEMMGKHAIILQVVCDNNCLLRDVCVGCPGGKTIKEIFETSPLFKNVTDKDGSLCAGQFHLLGGTELPLLNNLLTPYKPATEELTEQQYQYNLLHESVMTIVERTFKYLENRFPRLTTVEKPELSSLITSCICVLHNFTRIRNDSCELYTGHLKCVTD